LTGSCAAETVALQSESRDNAIVLIGLPDTRAILIEKPSGCAGRLS